MGSGTQNGLTSHSANDESSGNNNGVGGNCVSSDVEICASGNLEKRLACLDTQLATTTIGLTFS